MVQEKVSELLSRHGMFLGDLDDQGMPQLDGEDEFHSTYQQISLVVGHDHDLGIGTLHTSARNLYWCSQGGDVACIAFRAITMHAMSDDASVHERPCIYCQVDSAEAMNVLEEGCDLASNEVLLVPSDEASLKPLFEALCKGAEANPDEVEDDEGDFFFDADEMRQGLNQAEHENLDTLVERLQLGSTPANVAQLNSSAVPSDSPLPEVGFENEEEK